MQIGVIGAGQCSSSVEKTAEEVGREIAKHKAVLICGGLGGVMEAAARGAQLEGGLTIGILPGTSKESANPYIDVSIITDIGHARNVLVVRSSDAIIALGGSYGTLSEIAIGIKLKIPIIGLNTWEISKEIIQAKTAKEAVSIATSFLSHFPINSS
ncbi:MAG: TIGR00725 family protein [Thermodesulfobacteriota bacterium]|nr:TIGR00725 family protein [Thermodesulfobacteriota bacterium]